MRALVQRVRWATVRVDSKLVAEIEKGLLVLLGVHQHDTEEQARWMAHKIANLRLFADENDKMNLSVRDTGAHILVVSQFTLYGDCTKGFRPSFMQSARPEKAQPLYEYCAELLASEYQITTKRGIFGAMMDVELLNWGPVTVLVEKENDSPDLKKE